MPYLPTGYIVEADKDELIKNFVKFKKMKYGYSLDAG
jgi:hypothetical protein